MNLTRTTLRVVLLLICGGATCPARSVGEHPCPHRAPSPDHRTGADIHTPRMRVLDIAAQVQRYHDFMAYERQRRTSAARCVTTSGRVLIPPRRPGDDTLEHRPSTATTAVQSDERIPIAFGRRSDSRVETATSADGASIRASAVHWRAARCQRSLGLRSKPRYWSYQLACGGLQNIPRTMPRKMRNMHRSTYLHGT